MGGMSMGVVPGIGPVGRTGTKVGGVSKPPGNRCAKSPAGGAFAGTVCPAIGPKALNS